MFDISVWRIIVASEHNMGIIWIELKFLVCIFNANHGSSLHDKVTVNEIKVFEGHFKVKRVIAVCIYHLVTISIERSETAPKSALEIQGKFSPRQNVV